MLKRLLGVALLCLLAAPAFAADVRLTWEAPTLCEDNTPIVNCPVTGYEISEAATPTGPTWGIRETVTSTVTSRIYQIPPGQRCFTLKSVSNTVKSEIPTPVACVTVPVVPPKAPSGVTVTVQITVATP